VHRPAGQVPRRPRRDRPPLRLSPTAAPLLAVSRTQARAKRRAESLFEDDPVDGLTADADLGLAAGARPPRKPRLRARRPRADASQDLSGPQLVARLKLVEA